MLPTFPEDDQKVKCVESPDLSKIVEKFNEEHNKMKYSEVTTPVSG